MRSNVHVSDLPRSRYLINIYRCKNSCVHLVDYTVLVYYFVISFSELKIECGRFSFLVMCMLQLIGHARINSHLTGAR